MTSESADLSSTIWEIVRDDNINMLVFFAVVVLIAVVLAFLRGFLVPLIFFSITELVILYAIWGNLKESVRAARFSRTSDN